MAYNIENVGKRTIRILIGRLIDVMGDERQCLPWHTSVASDNGENGNRTTYEINTIVMAMGVA
jgi:hypothetical protein